ncbi:MAG: hypothetical protein AB7N91_01950 [Candidatus Tectimicrobiota bacterium]
MKRLFRSMFSILSISGMFLSLPIVSVRAADAATSLPDIELIRVEGATVTHEVTDYDGRTVRVTEPAHSMTAVRTTNNDGIVRGTLTAVDTTTRQVKMRTDAGQMLVLSLSPNLLQTVEVGASIEFVLPERSSALMPQ